VFRTIIVSPIVGIRQTWYQSTGIIVFYHILTHFRVACFFNFSP